MRETTAMCPSAPWNSEGGQIFGVVAGDVEAPRVIFLKQLLAPSKELEQRIGAAKPEEVFRVAAPCAQAACGHHDGASKQCTLVKKTVRHVDPVVQQAAVCPIRAQCVWWRQEATAACLRCPQIATQNYIVSEQVATAATPSKGRSD